MIAVLPALVLMLIVLSLIERSDASDNLEQIDQPVTSVLQLSEPNLATALGRSRDRV